jgi:hypothetical protein
VSFRTVGTNTPNNIFITQQGIDYVLQYDSPNGGVQIIQRNAPAGTLPIYQNGQWNASATQIGLTPQQQSAYHSTVQQSIYQAYRAAGGTARGAVLPPFAQPSNFNRGPGQTSSTPSQNPSSSNNGTGNSLLSSIGNFTGTLANLEKAVSDFSVNGSKFGVSNESTLFKETLLYPSDMNIEQQDTLQITGFRYRPSKAAALFGGERSAIDLLTNGFQTQSNFTIEQKIGLVILPMPNKVADSNNVSWGEDAMNNLAAAATAATLTPGGLASSAIAGGLSKALGGSFGAGVVTANVLRLLGSGAVSPELSLLLGPSFASKILKAGGFGVETESILARGAGIIPNSNLELLFNGPTLRTFTFTYRLTPREESEAVRVRKIIRFFKQSMAAKKITATGGAAGQASFFLGTPNIFKLEYRTGGNGDKDKGQLIDGVNRFKTCALSSFQCDYTPDGFWAAYQAGQPVSTVMSMTFNELEPIYDTDYQDNVFNTRSDLNAVNDQSVGY